MVRKKIEIKYDHTSYSETIGVIDFGSIEPTDDAYPTSRVLEGSEDHGYDEEWHEPGQLPDGRKGHTVYLFDSDDINRATITCPDNPPENYPWDDNHVKCFVVVED